MSQKFVVIAQPKIASLFALSGFTSMPVAKDADLVAALSLVKEDKENVAGVLVEESLETKEGVKSKLNALEIPFMTLPTTQ